MTKRHGNKVAVVAGEYVKAAGIARRLRRVRDGEGGGGGEEASGGAGPRGKRLGKRKAIGQTCGSNLS
jgi:hypothetical protein